MIYILVAGGVFNTVLVPHLVRSMNNDDDGGQTYASRVPEKDSLDEERQALNG